MKKIFLSVLLLTFFNNFSQTPFLWAKTEGGAIADNARCVTADVQGNVITGGAFQSNGMDFDPGPGTYTLPNNGSDDIFISKLDAAGNLVWVKSMGGTGTEQAVSITTDASSNVLITGLFSGTVDMDPGPGVTNLVSSGGVDIYVCKLNSSGNFMWAKKFGSNSSEEGDGIAVDANGNVYAAGKFNNTIDFDPGPGTFTLASFGMDDAFILKLDANGNFVYAKQLGGSSSDAFESITLDQSGNVYASGYFFSVADLDPGPAIASFTAMGSYDGFVLKLDAAGNYVWARQFAGPFQEEGASIKVDGSGNVITGGQISGVCDFDPGPGTYTLAPSGTIGPFVCMLNGAGNFVWARTFIGGSSVEVFGIDLDPSGTIYAVGQFDGTVDFDPGPGTATITSAGFLDAFLSKLDNNGNYLWAGSLSGPSAQGAEGVVYSNGAFYACGHLMGTTDFDAGPGTFTVATQGSDDIYTVRYNNCMTAPSLTGSISGPSLVCGTPGTVIYSIAPVAGAVSYSWSLPFGFAGTSTTNIITATISASGTLSLSAINACGVSSVLTKSVTADTSIITIQKTNICCFGNCNGSATLSTVGYGPFSFTWSPGPVTQTINSLCAGNYSVQVNDALGCTFTNTFSIVQPPLLSATISASSSTICTGQCATLNVNASGGMGAYSYTWLPGNFSITTITVCPTSDFTYTLFLNDSCCSHVSTKTIYVSTCTGFLQNFLAENNFSISPNPASSLLNISVGEQLLNSECKVYDLIGKEVISVALNKKVSTINIEALLPGIYFVKVRDLMMKVVRE